MELRRAVRNEIVEAIEASKFSLAEFIRDEGDEALCVHHKPTTSEMVVNHNPLSGGYTVSWNVGSDPWDEVSTGALGPATATWLTALEGYLETPDLWSEFGKQPLGELMEGEDNTTFTPAEQDRIAEVLDEIKSQAAETYGLPDAELRALNAKIDYLLEARKHTRRKDWLIVAVTIISQPIVSEILTPSVMHKVLAALDAGLAGLFGHPQMLGG